MLLKELFTYFQTQELSFHFRTKTPKIKFIYVEAQCISNIISFSKANLQDMTNSFSDLRN